MPRIPRAAVRGLVAPNRDGDPWSPSSPPIAARKAARGQLVERLARHCCVRWRRRHRRDSLDEITPPPSSPTGAQLSHIMGPALTRDDVLALAKSI
jgi:hypothetical protein